MARLIIIGNGYDMSRLNGATSYKEFGKWLCDRFNLSLKKKNNLPFSKDISVYTSDFYTNIIYGFPINVTEKIDDERNSFFAAMLVNMIQDLCDKDWSKFEDDLARLPWAKYIKKANRFFGEIKLCGSPVSYGTDFITSSVKTIYSLFSEWASELEKKIDNYNLVKKSFENSVNEIKQNDSILVFNYTDTFEKIMSVESTDPRVCHIHGISSDKTSIVVGHGCFPKSNSSNMDNVSDYIKDTKVQLYKNVEKYIIDRHSFWDKISSDFSYDFSNEIWVYGWNGKGVDEPYLNKITQIVNNSKKECTLFLNNYKCDGYKKKKVWKRNGFHGNILFFKDNNN